jgi:hypothetical protein
MPCVPVVELRVAAPIPCRIRKERAIAADDAIAPIVCITKFRSIDRLAWFPQSYSWPWQAFRKSRHIDIPQRDEPGETAVLMRCCSISSVAPSSRSIAPLTARRNRTQ